MYRSAHAIDQTLRWYAINAASFCRYVALEPSFGGRPIGALRLRFPDGRLPAKVKRGGGLTARPAVLLLAGLHGDELMLPDILMDFVERLFFRRSAWPINYEYWADDSATGGNGTRWLGREVKVWDAQVVEKIRQTLDLVILPLANPDGRELVLGNRADAMNTGRKNQRPTAFPPHIGVDLNRNFSLPRAHGIRHAYGPVPGAAGQPTAAEPLPPRIGVGPARPDYPGQAPFSEVETLNVRDLLGRYPFECMIDLHMNAEKVFYPWGHAPTQQRDPVANNYMHPNDLLKHWLVAKNAANAMNLVGPLQGESFSFPPPSYGAGNVHDLYGKAPGSALDYAYATSLHGPRTLYSFCLEIGRYPNPTPHPLTARNEIDGKFTPQAFTGILTILEACAERTFATPEGVKAVNTKPKLVGLYSDVLKGGAIRALTR